MDDVGNIHQDEEKIAECFLKYYINKSGSKTSYPKFLTKQEQYLSCNMFHLFRQWDECDIPIQINEVREAIRPVSYTHLDVYKRQ